MGKTGNLTNETPAGAEREEDQTMSDASKETTSTKSTTGDGKTSETPAG